MEIKKLILIILIIALISLSGCKQKATIYIKEIQSDGKIIDDIYIVEDKEYFQMEISNDNDTITGSVPLVSNKHFLIEK